MRLAPCNIGLYHFFAINLLYCDCGSVEAQLPHERRIPGTIPGICQDYILLLWVFREPIVALSIKKAHRPSLPVAAINIGTLVPILFRLRTEYGPAYCLHDDLSAETGEGIECISVRISSQ